MASIADRVQGKTICRRIAQTMLTRYWDRRRFIRVPASGPARWRSGQRTGHCELHDISPGGAGLRMPALKASALGPTMSVEVDLPAGGRWQLAENARVVRRAHDGDGMCLIGIEFATR